MVKTGNIEIQQTGNVFKDWKKVEKRVVRTAEQVCGIKKRQTNDWLAGHMEELQKLIEERKETLRVWSEVVMEIRTCVSPTTKRKQVLLRKQHNVPHRVAIRR